MENPKRGLKVKSVIWKSGRIEPDDLRTCKEPLGNTEYLVEA